MSMPPKGYHDAEVYLQVEPVFGRTWINGEWQETVTSLRVVGMTQKRPGRPKSGTVTTRITLRMPDGAFLPLRPAAIVTVPENMTITNPVEVEAADANQEDQR